ncbi:protein unc-13 homolog isoform X2 [Gastrolobium bilobum]|uniref:protein unc-13 homolog isoform X2 n=1 Tax=Gastrolobium bilobum TaxID=150636 RepID=UPI002AAF47C4|nr:protein unc-13 homolog isoform X2 [Gastrolobium bilobum]
MSISFRDRAIGGSKKHQPLQNAMPVHPIEDLHSPFGDPGPNLPESELRETAYEILVGACRSSGPKPLTFISQSERGDRDRSPAPAASLNRSLTSTAASKVKKALGLKTASLRKNSGNKRAVTTGELMRVQMKISEQSDTRIRRALLRIAAGQLGRRMESVVLPLELIQLFKSSDFPSQQEYEAWLRRNLKLLEAGLLLYPHLPLDKADTSAQRLRRIIHGALEKPMDLGKGSESMQTLRSAVMSLACRSSDGSVPETCHWADGFPLNLWIYQTLLEACFDIHAENSVIEEVDDVLELIKKTWVMLGINEMLHNICFSWVLFQRYVATGQMENDLLFASSNLLAEVEKDTKTMKDPFYSKTLSSTLSLMLSWAEKRLLAYHDTFHNDNIESMESIVSLAVLSAKILAEDISHDNNWKRKETDVACTRVENYIRSSLRAVFAQASSIIQHPSRKQNKAFPALSVLARDITELAINEKAIFSSKLKRWHPLAAGVAVATLHVCYGNELKQYVKGVTELTPNAIEVLLAADKLEKDLVQIAVEDSVDSEDGGKSIIREMQPYEAEAVIASLVKSWMKIRVDRLGEWIDRKLQQEVWNPKANKEGYAPSAVEVLRFIDDTLEAFFLLPIPMHAVLLPELMSGLDKSLQQYILKAKSGCGNRNSFIPTMPALTRCSTRAKFHGVFRKKEKSQMTQRRKGQVGTTNGDNSFDIPQMCVRVNTMQRIRMELGVLEKRIVANLSSSKSSNDDDITNGMSLKFKFSAAAAVESIHQLCECIAYKVVFHNLCHVLWDGLYVGEVSATRIEPFLQELEQYLEIISSTVHDKVRTRVIIELMQASFDGFLLVLLAGGPSRAFSLQDSVIIEEDLKFLTDLFWSNGDGLPAELIEKHSTTVRGVLPLFHADTEHIIQQFSQLTMEMYGSSAKSRLPFPPTADQWSPREPNTLLRVLCYRNDEAAAKFLKKNYNLPTKV